MNGSRTKNPNQRYILKVSAKISGFYFAQSEIFCHVNSLDTIKTFGESENTDLYQVRLGMPYKKSQSAIHPKGPFKYYVSKEVGGWGGKMLMFADKVGGDWG